MSSPKEWVQTLGELGHSAEFWNRLFSNPKQFFTRDLPTNPLSVFSMAAPLAQGGGAAVLAFALIGLAGIPACIQSQHASRETEVLDPVRRKTPAPLPDVAVSRPPAPPLPPSRGIILPPPLLAVPRPPSPRVIPQTPCQYIGRSPRRYLSFLDRQRLPNRKAIMSFDAWDKRLRSVQTPEDWCDAQEAGHDVDRRWIY